MNWNHAAEELLGQILRQTPRPLRDGAGRRIREIAEARAVENGLNRVGVQTVIAARVESTPTTLRPELARQFEVLGLDAADYEGLLADC
jgi:hypothetical protein